MSRPFRWTGSNLDAAEDFMPGEVIAQHYSNLLIPDPDNPDAYQTAHPGDTITRTDDGEYRIN